MNSGYSTVFFVISPKLYGIYYIEEDHLMKKSRIERVKKYSMLSLIVKPQTLPIIKSNKTAN